MNRRSLIKGVGAALLALRLHLVPDTPLAVIANVHVIYYNPRSVVITIDGQRIKGFADGAIIEVGGPDPVHEHLQDELRHY